MTWVSWRLQRTETVVAAAIAAAVAALLVPTGLQMATAYTHDGLGACAGASTSSCGAAIQAFSNRFAGLEGIVGWLNLVPGVVGVLLASPLLLELENGTYRLAWTQSVTRRRWLAGRLGLTVAAALLFALAFELLLSWWRGPFDHLDGRMQAGAFDFEGTVPFAYVAFALGLALAVGVLWRRTVAAVVVGFAGYIATRVFVDSWLRPRFEHPLTATWSARGNGPDLSHAWVLFQRPSDRFGHTLPPSLLFQKCPGPLQEKLGKLTYGCPGHRSGIYTHAVFQPAGRFWAFQGIETALFGGIAAVLILFAAWWIYDRVT